jgi:hypothetical protein
MRAAEQKFKSQKVRKTQEVVAGFVGMITNGYMLLFGGLSLYAAIHPRCQRISQAHVMADRPAA